MYNDLIESLRYEAAFAYLGSDGKRLAGMMRKAADAIEELQGRAKVLEKLADKWCEAVPKWIPVTERLPDVFKHVLVNIPGMAPHPTVQEAFREKNGLWYSNGFRYEAGEITHWMPLPQPPKEES